MRYQSFYPFALNQPPTYPLGQPGFEIPTMPNQAQAFGQPVQGGAPNQPFPNPSQGGPEAPGSSKMESYMATANQFLNTAQQFAPVVQQFAPMVQNLPAMWKLYKGFQSLPPAGSGAVGGSVASAAAQSAGSNSNFGPSVPRIFQPPGF
ncbi:VrrA/YqfQ family protein [Sporosarcina sp. G11-34]|uniref:VrrA/YqfQ family protein n=1 Tax=Sporosarcina sp. G11-34 TaxID=2849605 RepID=UPI0022A99DB7|nr:VrrA/YqfQ family protein [Sporosarcina sp. G11-34]MCZ2259342.1 YqfQ family protein [Sporosarcina sp. G11-34]